jgi:hypothetical protein
MRSFKVTSQYKPIGLEILEKNDSKDEAPTTASFYSFEDPSFQHEISVRKCELVWIRNSELFQKFSVEEPILYSCFSFFENSGKQKLLYLCLLLERGLWVYNASSGTQSDIIPAFTMRAIFPLPVGIVIHGEDFLFNSSSFSYVSNPLQDPVPITNAKFDQILYSCTQYDYVIGWDSS